MAFRKITDADMVGQGMEALKSGVYKEEKDFVAATADALVRTTVKTIFNELVDKLESVTDGASGADSINYRGIFDTVGLGITIKQALANAKIYMDNLAIAAGAGDMLKSVFATNGTEGRVDDSLKLKSLNQNDGATGIDETTNNAIWSAYKILSLLKEGWIPANEVWTYVSATSITISGDVAEKYKKHPNIRYKQGGSYKYNTIITSSYNSGTGLTTLTTHAGYITAAGDSSFAAADITDNYYSHISPTDFPVWFNWAPTFTGFSANPAGIHRFKIEGSAVHIKMRHSAAGTSNSAAFTVSAPVPAKTISGMYWSSLSLIYNNGTQGAGEIQISSAATSLTINPSFTSALWTATGGKAVPIGQIEYEI